MHLITTALLPLSTIQNPGFYPDKVLNYCQPFSSTIQVFAVPWQSPQNLSAKEKKDMSMQVFYLPLQDQTQVPLPQIL